jgi:hypothetical protein
MKKKTIKNHNVEKYTPIIERLGINADMYFSSRVSERILDEDIDLYHSIIEEVIPRLRERNGLIDYKEYVRVRMPALRAKFPDTDLKRINKYLHQKWVKEPKVLLDDPGSGELIKVTLEQGPFIEETTEVLRATMDPMFAHKRATELWRVQLDKTNYEKELDEELAEHLARIEVQTQRVRERDSEESEEDRPRGQRRRE